MDKPQSLAAMPQGLTKLNTKAVAKHTLRPHREGLAPSQGAPWTNCSTLQHATAQHTTPHCTTHCCHTTLHCDTPHHTTPHCTAPHCTALRVAPSVRATAFQLNPWSILWCHLDVPSQAGRRACFEIEWGLGAACRAAAGARGP